MEKYNSQIATVLNANATLFDSIKKDFEAILEQNKSVQSVELCEDKYGGYFTIITLKIKKYEEIQTVELVDCEWEKLRLICDRDELKKLRLMCDDTLVKSVLNFENILPRHIFSVMKKLPKVSRD